MWSKNCNMYAASRGPLWKWRQNFNWNALSKAAVCTQKCKIWKVLNTSGKDIWFKPKGNFGLKTILHKECFAMVGNVHFKLGFIDKLVWHFEKLHKFQFNQQGGGRGTFLSTFYPRILCDKSQSGTSSKEFELRNFLRTKTLGAI